MKKFVLKGLLVMALSLTTILSASALDGKGFQQIRIGDIEAVVLSDGYVPVSPIQPSMAPDIAQKQLTDFLAAKGENTESLELAMNLLLLKKGEKYIIFDTGAGSGMGPTGGWLKDNLAAIGVSPEQITDIVITHAHLDHIGGLLDANGKSAYPNAAIYITKTEHDFWTGSNPDFSKSKLKDEAMMKTMLQFTQHILATLQPQIKLIDDKATLLDCIEVNLAPGHTPGHIVSTIFSNDDKLFVMADIIHASTILFAHPEWGNGFDWDFELGIETRKRVLKELSNSGALVFGYHLPYPGIGHVKQIATDSYEWQPASFATPQIKD